MKCLIVDDDPLICDLVEHFCSKMEEIDSTLTVQNGFEAINLLQSNDFDVVFLDFDLPDVSGKDILNMLPRDIKVIMITSKKEFAAESYDFEQIEDFLVKPIEFSRFHKAVQKVSTSVEYKPEPKIDNNAEELFVKDGNRLVKVRLKDVVFFKSESNYVQVNMGDKKILTLLTMKDLNNKLPKNFTRVHRSYFVNLDSIESIEKGLVVVNGTEIPVSDSYEKQLLQKINLLN